jgi:hypothetical protein
MRRLDAGLPAVVAALLALFFFPGIGEKGGGNGADDGRRNGVPMWVFSLLVLLIVGVVLALAIVFLVPPAPPPYR